MTDEATILCEISAKLDRLTGGGEVTSLILPVTIGNNQPQRFVEANPGRVGLVIHNNSGVRLYLALSGDEVQISPGTYYSFIVEPDDHLILDQRGIIESYKGEIWGIWGEGAPDNSRALITELSLEANR